MTTYKSIPFQFDEIGDYRVEGEAEICIFKDGDGSDREYITHAVEYVEITSITDENGDEVELEDLREIEDAVAEKILDMDMDYDDYEY